MTWLSDGMMPEALGVLAGCEACSVSAGTVAGVASGNGVSTAASFGASELLGGRPRLFGAGLSAAKVSGTEAAGAVCDAAVA